ncbi:MAG: integron integrase [Planctomycetota bacterium]
MSQFSKVGSQEQQLKWAWIWFRKLAQFHSRAENAAWQYTADDVIAYLRSRRDQGVPAWKRMRIIEGLMDFRHHVQQQSVDELRPLQRKMREIIAIERVRDQGPCVIDDAPGRIDPREPDAVQALRKAVRAEGLQFSTEKAYVKKLKAFMAERHLSCLADFDSITDRDVEDHLSTMAVDGNVAASTQNQAFHALLKFFTLVLKRDLGRIEAIRANKGNFIPTVLDEQEVIGGMRGVYRVIALLLYGCGMRISEALSLRVKDLDFANRQIEIRDSKFEKSRLVPMPDSLVADLQRWADSRRVLHEHDLSEGTSSVYLPYALSRKYPEAHRDLKWQFLFASPRLARDPRTGRLHRHHLHRDSFAQRLRQAVIGSGLMKRITSHTFRHCFASHHLWAGTNIREIQRLLGHADLKTTEIYTHVRNPNAEAPLSPLDRLSQTKRKVIEQKEMAA